jgi:hypothetical protein
MTKLQTAIQHAINCASAENGSDTPDFIITHDTQWQRVSKPNAMAQTPPEKKPHA